MHDDPPPAEVFLQVKGSNSSSEIVAHYDVIARLMNVALQYGASLENLGDLFTGAKFTPCDSVAGHDRLKHCPGLPNLIGRHLLVEYCGRDGLAHVPHALADVSELQEAQP